MELNHCIANLIAYSKKNLSLPDLDAIYVANLLYKEWGIISPYAGEIDEEAISKMTRLHELPTDGEVRGIDLQPVGVRVDL